MKKYLANVLWEIELIAVLAVVLTIIKGGIDLFQTGHLFWTTYLITFLRGMGGSVIFFGGLELIQALYDRHRNQS